MQPQAWCYRKDDASSAPRERESFVSYLRRYGRPEDSYFEAELLFGEIVENVALHAPGPIEIIVEWVAGKARLHVSDNGGPLERPMREACELFAEYGRGLFLVRSLADDMRITLYADEGKTISVELPIRLAA